jgi:hypothetical protein
MSRSPIASSRLAAGPASREKNPKTKTLSRRTQPASLLLVTTFLLARTGRLPSHHRTMRRQSTHRDHLGREKRRGHRGRRRKKTVPIIVENKKKDRLGTGSNPIYVDSRNSPANRKGPMGADAHSSSGDKNRELELELGSLCKRCDTPGVESFFLRHGAAPTLLDRWLDDLGSTALVFSAERGCTPTVRLLLGLKASVDRPDLDGQTALMFAAMNGHTEAAKMLLRAKASVNATDK